MAAGLHWLWAGCLAGIGGVAVLRHAWGLPLRSATWNGAGWALLVLAVVLGWQAAGAWGVAVAVLVATVAAFAALAVAGARSPPGRAAPPKRRAHVLPDGAEPLRLVRRLVTFLLVVPGGWLAALALGLGLRALGILLGWGEANANVAALFAVPIAWAMFATIVLMQTRRRSQIATLAFGALAALPLLMMGA